jgi:hypothetical protein
VEIQPGFQRGSPERGNAKLLPVDLELAAEQSSVFCGIQMVQLGAAHLGVFPEATIDSVLGQCNSFGIAILYRLFLG